MTLKPTQSKQASITLLTESNYITWGLLLVKHALVVHSHNNYRCHNYIPQRKRFSINTVSVVYERDRWNAEKYVLRKKSQEPLWVMGNIFIPSQLVMVPTVVPNKILTYSLASLKLTWLSKYLLWTFDDKDDVELW